MDRFIPLLQKLLAVGGVVAIGYVGETGQDGGFVKDVWAAMKTASPPVAMVMLMLFLDERRERRDSQKELNERTIDFIQSTNGANATFGKALDKLTTVTAATRRRRR